MNPCASIDGEEVVLATGTLGKFVGATGDTVVHGTYRDSGTWAPELLRLLLEDLLGKGGTLIDIGANIGLVAIPVTEDSSVRTFAFEPDPRNAELLRRNVALHDLENRISVHESALWSRSGEMTLQRDRENHGDQRLVHAPTTGIPSVTVPLARLDTLVEADALESPVVAKIDTQGAEVDVLQGAGALLSRIDAAIVEVWPSGSLVSGESSTNSRHCSHQNSATHGYCWTTNPFGLSFPLPKSSNDWRRFRRWPPRRPSSISWSVGTPSRFPDKLGGPGAPTAAIAYPTERFDADERGCGTIGESSGWKLKPSKIN